MVGQHGPGEARRAFGEGARAIGLHEMQHMIGKERPDGQAEENTWGGGGSSRRECHVSGVKLVFPDVIVSETQMDLGCGLKTKSTGSGDTQYAS